MLLNIDQNLNIYVATGKGHWVSLLTSRSVPLALKSLTEIPEVSLITGQVS